MRARNRRPDSLNALLVDGLTSSPERPVRYQWFRLGANGGPLPNATNALLRIDAFQPEDNGYYQCRVSNDCGDRLSLSVPLTAGAWVIRDPSPTTNEVCTTTQLDVSALGKGTLRFQWRRNGDPLSPEDPRVTGAHLPTLTFTALRYLDDATYDCVVNDSCNSVTSRVANSRSASSPPAQER